MYYSQDEFFRLLDEIESQGGEHLDKTHENVYHTDFTGDSDAVKGHEVVYCGESALFLVPYAPMNAAPGVMHSVEVCAVDDCMGLWPRFLDAEAPGTP